MINQIDIEKSTEANFDLYFDDGSSLMNVWAACNKPIDEIYKIKQVVITGMYTTPSDMFNNISECLLYFVEDRINEHIKSFMEINQK